MTRSCRRRSSPMGKIVIGALSGTAGVVAEYARYNADGTLDATFGVSGMSMIVGGGEPFSIVVLADNRIMSSGGALPYGSTIAVPVLTRLLPDGLADPTWGSGGFIYGQTGTFSAVFTSIDATLDGKLMVGGVTQAGSMAGLGFYLARYGFRRALGRSGALTERLPHSVQARSVTSPRRPARALR